MRSTNLRSVAKKKDFQYIDRTSLYQVDTKLASRKSSTEVRKTSVPKKISTNLPIPDLSLVTARIDTEGTEVKLSFW